jgi:hypothetical protein
MSPLATVGILSIGEMGMGIAKLLVAHNYRVVTNLEGRRYVSPFYIRLLRQALRQERKLLYTKPVPLPFCVNERTSNLSWEHNIGSTAHDLSVKHGWYGY